MALLLPGYLKGRTSALANLTTGLGSSQPAHVSLKDDRFTLIDENGLPSRTFPPTLELKFVVVGSAERASRVYYAGAFSADDAAAPTCYSDDALTPALDAAVRQSETCGQCSQAVWGSKVSANGNKIPACSTRKKIAVIVPETGTAKIYLLSIPPASLKAWRNYVDYVVGNGASPQYVITSAKMNDKELSFDAVDFVPPKIADAVDMLIEKEAVQIAMVVGDVLKAKALPAPSEADMAAAAAILSTPPAKLLVDEPPRRAGRPRKQETVVGPGPIPDGAFSGLPDAGADGDELAEMERKVAAMRAAKAASAMTAVQAEKFIQEPKAAFGISDAAPPPPKGIEDMLAKAFS